MRQQAVSPELEWMTGDYLEEHKLTRKKSPLNSSFAISIHWDLNSPFCLIRPNTHITALIFKEKEFIQP